MKNNLSPPSISKVFNQLKISAPWLIAIEIIELAVIIIVIAILEPRISQIISRALPGLGMHELMEIYPMRNITITVLASIGIITSFYDQLNYINIMQKALSNKCYEEYKNALYEKVISKHNNDSNSRCVLEVLQSERFDNESSLLSKIIEKCNVPYNNALDLINQIHDNLCNIIDKLAKIDRYRDSFCEDKLYVNLNLVTTSEKVSEYIKKCSNRLGKVSRSIYAYLSLLPFIILPIIIAII